MGNLRVNKEERFKHELHRGRWGRWSWSTLLIANSVASIREDQHDLYDVPNQSTAYNSANCEGSSL